MAWIRDKGGIGCKSGGKSYTGRFFPHLRLLCQRGGGEKVCGL